MRLITSYELANKHSQELRSLYALTFNTLVQSNAACIQRSNALASLENICRVMHQCEK